MTTDMIYGLTYQTATLKDRSGQVKRVTARSRIGSSVGVRPVSLSIELRNSCGVRSNWTSAGYPACATLMVRKPTLISSNTIGPIMALGRRAADLILEDVR